MNTNLLKKGIGFIFSSLFSLVVIKGIFDISIYFNLDYFSSLLLILLIISPIIINIYLYFIFKKSVRRYYLLVLFFTALFLDLLYVYYSSHDILNLIMGRINIKPF